MFSNLCSESSEGILHHFHIDERVECSTLYFCYSLFCSTKKSRFLGIYVLSTRIFQYDI
nr:MAG TPA: hypothetical protein [Caudoviricetes sp.]